jgi:protein-tyrosine phosphatase
VCTANICRSPAFEALLGNAVGPSVRVSSAGLRARVGEDVDPDMRKLLDGFRPDFAARQVTPDLLRAADLVLTMTRDQRSAVVGLEPGAVRRAFTVREFAALVAMAADRGVGADIAAPGRRLAALAAAAPRLRSLRAAGDDDVPDPYGRGADAHERAHALLRDAVAAIVAAVGSPRLH